MRMTKIGYYRTLRQAVEGIQKQGSFSYGVYKNECGNRCFVGQLMDDKNLSHVTSNYNYDGVEQISKDELSGQFGYDPEFHGERVDFIEFLSFMQCYHDELKKGDFSGMNFRGYDDGLPKRFLEGDFEKMGFNDRLARLREIGEWWIENHVH